MLNDACVLDYILEVKDRRLIKRSGGQDRGSSSNIGVAHDHRPWSIPQMVFGGLWQQRIKSVWARIMAKSFGAPWRTEFELLNPTCSVSTFNVF